MAISLQTRLSGGMGSKRVSGTTEVTGLNKFCLTALEDTTFTSITGADENGTVVDLLTTWNLTGVTLTTDMGTFFCASNHTITAVKLATGSVKLD